MFWENKKQKEKREIFSPPSPPPKIEFQTMMELLMDAEKYNRNGEKVVSNATLRNLCEYIERHASKTP